VILHVDMDAFYASVATRARPDWQEVPVIVGGGLRGVVLSANYLARKYGVRSAQPMTQARRLCPLAVVVAPEFEEFSQVSASVMALFRKITPQVEALSMDEAFLDVRGSIRRLGSPRFIAELLRAQIHDEQRITCSVGVAPSATVAKIASQQAKPDGVVVVEPAEVTKFLHPLEVGALWGVGPKTSEVLNRLGLYTIADVAHTPRGTLIRALGAACGRQLHELSWGIDHRMVTPSTSEATPDKSMGADETFSRDIDETATILRELLRLSAKVAHRLRQGKVVGRVVSIKVRFADFTTITRSKTLGDPTDITHEIYATAATMYNKLGLQRARVRLVGVRVEGLLPRSGVDRQLVLGERERGWPHADQAIDRATLRFGSGVVIPASLLSGSASTQPMIAKSQTAQL
jgi:DNA polymerase IV